MYQFSNDVSTSINRYIEIINQLRTMAVSRGKNLRGSRPHPNYVLFESPWINFVLLHNYFYISIKITLEVDANENAAP